MTLVWASKDFRVFRDGETCVIIDRAGKDLAFHGADAESVLRPLEAEVARRAEQLDLLTASLCGRFF